MQDKAAKGKSISQYLTFILLIFLVVACAPQSERAGGSEKDERGKALRLVATTTFVGDVIGEVGGEMMDLTVMLPPGANPHVYQPAPQDITAVTEADVVFANGLGLETFLEDLIANAGGNARVVHVSDGIEVRTIQDGNHEGQNEPEEDQEQEAGNPDPHVWFDPNNIIIWTENIERALVELDPDHRSTYHQNAEDYRAELGELDRWIQDQVSKIPPKNRTFVTDHTVFSYFAERYGFEQTGAVVPAATTEAQPSGKQLAELQDMIQEHDVQAIFVGRDFDPTLAERVAEDTGVEMVRLYFGSLTPSGGPADSYIKFMKVNVKAIVDALGGK